MIRPRGPPPTTTTTPSQNLNNPLDFIYTPTEHATMASSIREFGASGLLSPALGDGFVLGVLRHDDDGAATGGRAVVLDGERNGELVGLARRFGLRCVLHRAVDEVLSDGCGGGGVAMVGEGGVGEGGVEGGWWRG
ncbi:hypothetical protein B0I37DRAFT_447430 [Chaetomium sp. MPI-CAGE-AT-0009]|nr:hypothetical protein B0I37DRAFT_447430 [Chaetomium sp. MPI-CAGE-AT-0009]